MSPLVGIAASFRDKTVIMVDTVFTSSFRDDGLGNRRPSIGTFEYAYWSKAAMMTVWPDDPQFVSPCSGP
jgi:hypothetical protein